MVPQMWRWAQKTIQTRFDSENYNRRPHFGRTAWRILKSRGVRFQRLSNRQAHCPVRLSIRWTRESLARLGSGRFRGTAAIRMRAAMPGPGGAHDGSKIGTHRTEAEHARSR